MNCAECQKPVTDAKGALAHILVRLVRDRAGKVHPWGTAERTAAPAVELCPICLSRLPLRSPVRVSRPPISVLARPIFERDLARMPPGVAVCGWPYWASCYLVPESLIAEKLPRAWEKLRASLETTETILREFRLFRRLLQLWRWWRPGR